MRKSFNFSGDLLAAVSVIRKGGTILYPTDTVWGIGCDATSESAVSGIYKIKGRAGNQPLIVLVNGLTMLRSLVGDIPESAIQHIKTSEKPLTIVYSGVKNIAHNAKAKDGSLGIRICNDLFCKLLITTFGKPLISTSANYSGQKTPAFFSEIDEAILDSCNYVVKYRQNEKKAHAPSTVIKLNDDGSFDIIRK